MRASYRHIALGILLVVIYQVTFAQTNTWTGNSSTTYGTSSNWSLGHVPTSAEDIVIPTAPTGARWPHFGLGENNRYCNNFTMQTGSYYYVDADATCLDYILFYGNVTIYGDLIKDPAACAVMAYTGGATPRTLIKSGGASNTMTIGIGNKSAYDFKLGADFTCFAIDVFSWYSGSFGMDDYDCSLRDIYILSTMTFYQGSGTLTLEGAASGISINNASFQEETGTTYFGSGINYPTTNQTIPSVTYNNLKIRTNSGNTVTLGSGSTVNIGGKYEHVTGSSGGSVSMANNNVNVTGTVSVTSGSTLNLNGTNSKAFTISGATITNDGTISGYNSGGVFELVATNSSMLLNGTGTWDVEAQFQNNLTITTGKTITVNSGYFSMGTAHGKFLTNNGTINGSTTLYHIHLDKDYTLSGSGTYAGMRVGELDKVTATLGADLTMTGSLLINDSDPDEVNVSTYDLTIGGSFVNNGTFTEGIKTVTFNGATTATIEGSATTTFYDLVVNKSAAGNTVTNASTKKAFQITDDLTVTQGTLVLQATDAHYVVGDDLTVAVTNGTLKHEVNYGTKYLNVKGDLDLSGTYTYTGYTPRVYMSTTGTKYIKCPSSSFYDLALGDGNYSANGNISVANNLWAMWNTVTGEFHTTGNTVTVNNGLFIDGGKVVVDGGLLDVTAGGVTVGKTDRAGILEISSGELQCSSLDNGDGTQLGTVTFTGGTLDINGNLTLNSSTSFATSNSPTMQLTGDWVNKGGTYSPAQTSLTFDGSSAQKINVTTAGGTTPYDSDFTFYDITCANSDGVNGVKMYYKTSTLRLLNINNVVINSSTKLAVVGN